MIQRAVFLLRAFFLTFLATHRPLKCRFNHPFLCLSGAFIDVMGRETKPMLIWVADLEVSPTAPDEMDRVYVLLGTVPEARPGFLVLTFSEKRPSQTSRMGLATKMEE